MIQDKKSFSRFGVKFSLFLALFLILGCNKNKPKSFTAFQILNVGDPIDLNHALFLNDSVGFAGGGKKYHYGYIYSTTNRGKSWKKKKLLGFSSVYSFGFFNDSTGWAGGDRLSFEKTLDGGKTWFMDGFGTDVPVHFYDRTPIRKYKFLDESKWNFIGGDAYNKGLFYRTENGGKNWSFKFFDHEIRGLSIGLNGDIFISGFGYVGKSNDDGKTFKKLDLEGDFYVGIECLKNNIVVSVGNNGGIYRSENGGVSWEKIRRKNGYFKLRRSYNDLKFYNDDVGIAIGNYGLISVSKDKGLSWTDYRLEGDYHLFSIEIHESEIVIASENGNIIIIDIASLI